MDYFAIYLVSVNIVTFLLFALMFFVSRRRGRDCDAGSAGGRALCLTALAGGGAGMLLALGIWSRRASKRSVAWWFAGIACLVAWGMICAVAWGYVNIPSSFDGLADGWDPARLQLLGGYLLAVNAVAFALFCVDKALAARGRSRIPEAVLLGVSFIGGAIGGILAMRVARHKTRKWYFTWGLPAFIVLQAAVLVFAHLAGAI